MFVLFLGTSNSGTNQVANNHQNNSNNNNVLTTTEIYWKTELGESSPPSMCIPAGAQTTLLVRQGSEGPDDLRVNNLGQHHPSQSSTPTNPYDAIATAIASSKNVGASAFTPIQTVPFHVTRTY